MKPILSAIFSPELPRYGEGAPADVHDFWLLMHADICVENVPGIASFTFHVTTARHLDRMSGGRADFHRPPVLVDAFSWDSVEAAVGRICAGIDADDWEGVLEQLLEWFEPY